MSEQPVEKVFETTWAILGTEILIEVDSAGTCYVNGEVVKETLPVKDQEKGSKE